MVRKSFLEILIGKIKGFVTINYFANFQGDKKGVTE